MLLPLFPLPVVVFPRTTLPLHIFEDRYKEMVGEAIASKTEFGMVLARDESIVNMGCTVVVENVLKRYPDGRMDVVTGGRRRFEIIALNQEKPYLRGEVEFFDDDEPGPAPPELRQMALVQYKGLLELGEPERHPAPQLADPQLSFQLTHGIGDLDFLQTLLSSRSEKERLKSLADFLVEYVPKQRQTAEMRRLAPLNGHGIKPPGI
ncbi:MAG: LON peptidase substrate-binding domain-containing protein [Bryobacteraceae bacterium]